MVTRRDLLKGLTDAQRQAVTHGEGPLLVLAGPGSGKTRVITTRVAHLLAQGVRPGQILAITFTNKAADEMRHRVERLVGRCGVWISTFHRLCVRLLRAYAGAAGIQPNFTIYDQDDRLKCITKVMKALELDTTHWRPAAVEAAISRAKNDLCHAAQYQERASDFFQNLVARVYAAYEVELRQANALDFDDLLLRTADLLRDRPEVRAELDERFRFVLIDEYQDTNLAQYAIARALSVDYPHICATGDPDQSIYGWRGANINNILQFEDDYPDATVVRLEQNYRSTQRILHAADVLIRHNRRRKHKELWTENEPGREVVVLELADEESEAQEVADRIAQYVSLGGRYGDVAVFVRINALTRVFEQALHRRGIPYQIVGGVEFFQRKEIKDILAYLRLIVNPADSVSFLRVVNVPARGLGVASVERLVDYATRSGISLVEAAAQADRIGSLGPKAAKQFKALAALIEGWRGGRAAAAGSVHAAVEAVIEATGYRAMLARSRDPGDEERLANIEELLTAADQYDRDHPAEEGTLEAFLEQTSLVSEADRYDDTGNVVTLMTLHAAKGLEFPVVFMPAVEEGLLPHARSQDNHHELEEERRLCFVGMTRAKRELTLSYVQYRSFRGQFGRTVRSRFIDELPADGVAFESLVDSPGFGRPVAAHDAYGVRDPEPEEEPAVSLAVGMLVRHPEFGLGRVLALEGAGRGRKATVKFGHAGQKRLLVAYARLEPVDPD